MLHRQHVKSFSCCAHVCFASWNKGHLLVIMSFLVTLRFFPSSALSGDQGRFATVSSCLYQNYGLDFLQVHIAEVTMPTVTPEVPVYLVYGWSFLLASSREIF